MKRLVDIPEAWEKCNIKFIKECIRNGKPYEERKTGKWIITARNGVLCSECKSGTRRMPMLFGRPMYKYCPFCGVKMEVDE